MRNSDQSNTSPRRGSKNRKPNNRNGRRKATSPSNRNGQQRSGNGQRSSSRGKSRNEISQAWAADTSTLSSHMPTAARNGRNVKGWKTENSEKTRSRGKSKPASGKNRPGKYDRNNSPNKRPFRSNNNVRAKTPAQDTKHAGSPAGAATVGNIDPFELFCAYHLGISKDKGYRTANINEVANRFRSEPGMIKQALKEYDMDPESLMDRDFDMALAQLDIQVAPEGVDRLELARGIYQEFQDAPRIKRDWNKILEEDRKENQKIFRD